MEEPSKGHSRPKLSACSPNLYSQITNTIDPSEPATWPLSVQRIVEGNPCPLDVEEALADFSLRVRHFTRLLPHEVQAIEDEGLRLYSRELFDRRIRDAACLGYISADVADELRRVTIPEAEDGQRGNRDFVCFTAGPSLETDPGSVRPLVQTWGGEGIYFAAGAKPYFPLLQTLGTPTAVHVNLPLSLQPSLTFFPSLEELLRRWSRDSEPIFGDVFSKLPIEPEHIHQIEQLNNIG